MIIVAFFLVRAFLELLQKTILTNVCAVQHTSTTEASRQRPLSQLRHPQVLLRQCEMLFGLQAYQGVRVLLPQHVPYHHPIDPWVAARHRQVDGALRYVHASIPQDVRWSNGSQSRSITYASHRRNRW